MKKVLVRMFLFGVLILLAGCATLPQPAEMQADIANFTLPKLPEDGKALVYVVRPSSLGGLVRFNVFVDNESPDSEMGYTRGAQYIHFNMTPGEHDILSVAENTARVKVKAEPGDIIFIEQEPQMGVLYARNGFFTLPDYIGKYHVKHLKVGTIIRQDKQ